MPLRAFFAKPSLNCEHALKPSLKIAALYEISITNKIQDATQVLGLGRKFSNSDIRRRVETLETIYRDDNPEKLFAVWDAEEFLMKLYSDPDEFFSSSMPGSFEENFAINSNNEIINIILNRDITFEEMASRFEEMNRVEIEDLRIALNQVSIIQNPNFLPGTTLTSFRENIIATRRFLDSVNKPLLSEKN